MEDQVGKEVRLLKCELTGQERNELNKKLSRLIVEIGQIEVEQSAIKSQFKARLDTAKAASTEAAGTLENGFMFKDVEIEKRKDFKRSMVYVIRKDTGEEIENRKMTAAEKQMELPIDKTEGKKR